MGADAPALTLSLGDAVWIRRRLDRLSRRWYNVVSAERDDDGGDFYLLVRLRREGLFGLDISDLSSVGFRFGGGAWLFDVQTFSHVFSVAVQKMQGSGTAAC